MKLRLLLGIVFFGLMSCSGDDASETVNTNEPVTETPADSVPPTNVEKHLKEVQRYFNGELAEVLKFENDRVKERFLYNESGQLFYEDYYTYNDQFMLIERHIISNAYEETETATETFMYDNQGRLSVINIEHNASFYTIRNFDYTTSGIISEDNYTYSTGNEFYSNKEYKLNEYGLVYKIIDGLNTTDATYSGYNMISYISSYENSGNTIIHSSQTNFNISTDVKGEFINRNNNMLGNNKFNQSLYKSNIVHYDTHYMDNSIIQGVTNTYTYEFDSDNYPIVYMSYEGENLFLKEIITNQE